MTTDDVGVHVIMMTYDAVDPKEIYAPTIHVDSTMLVTKAIITVKIPDEVGGIGTFPRKHHITLSDNATPIIYAQGNAQK